MPPAGSLTPATSPAKLLENRYEDAGERFGVLAVCTANICRSPAFEVLLRAALGPGADVDVSSAGLDPRVGSPVWTAMAEELDAPTGGFAARQVTAELVRGADLVLTMTREQRAAVVDRFPSAVRRTFTVGEFAALTALAVDRGLAVGDSPGSRLRAVTVQIPPLRGSHVAGPDDDIADPFGREPADYRRAAERIRAAVGTLVGALDPRPAAERAPEPVRAPVEGCR